MALHIADAMQTKPGGGQGGSVLVVVETSARLWFCLATAARSDAVLLSSAFKSRPFTFGAALDPALAAVALNVLEVGADDVVLDPCTGTGTLLVGAVERGATTIGLDQNLKFAFGCRANLDHLGLASVGGGFLRQHASTAWDGRCAVANHDARVPFAPEFPSLPTPTAIVTNVPHGR
jgi:tRNA G10  N-methylase Trm11